MKKKTLYGWTACIVAVGILFALLLGLYTEEREMEYVYVLTRTQILANIWDESENYVNDNTLTVYIKRLREKIEENPNKPEIIKTVRGMGYQIGV